MSITTNLIGHDLRKRSGASPRLAIFGFKLESPEDHISLLEDNESIFIVDVFCCFGFILFQQRKSLTAIERKSIKSFLNLTFNMAERIKPIDALLNLVFPSCLVCSFVFLNF